MSELLLRNTQTLIAPDVIDLTSRASVKDQLLERLREAFSDRNYNEVLQLKFDQVHSILNHATYPLIGLGALFCMRDHSTTEVSILMELILTTKDITDPVKAVDAIANKVVRMCFVDYPEAYSHLYSITMRCSIFSALVAEASEIWLIDNGVPLPDIY